MTAALLSIGTELTRGELVNTNASWLAEALTDLGIHVTEVVMLEDDERSIVSGLSALARRHELIITTGGLGPTTDDVTAECVALVLQVPLVRNETALAMLTERLARHGRSVSASNEKQTDLPEGSTLLPNPWGTAPGFSVQILGAQAFFLPGVPVEMKHLFEAEVAPRLSSLSKSAPHQLVVQTFGMRESAVNDRLDGIETEMSVKLGYRAHFPTIEIKIMAEHDDAGTAQERCEQARDEVVHRLGENIVFAQQRAELAKVVGDLCLSRGLTLCTAESCTGGMVAELLTSVSGSSRYFLGSIVAYDNAVKQAQLGVEKELLEQHGAVSEPVARSMAEGARRALRADAAISVTGIAGPGGGTEDKPVGLVHYAVSMPGATECKKLFFPSTRDRIRRLSAFAALALLRELVLKQDN